MYVSTGYVNLRGTYLHHALDLGDDLVGGEERLLVEGRDDEGVHVEGLLQVLVVRQVQVRGVPLLQACISLSEEHQSGRVIDTT